jgi:iron(III) transport system substrate-binding protein
MVILKAGLTTISLAMILMACGPTSPAVPAASQPAAQAALGSGSAPSAGGPAAAGTDWQADWEKTLAAAKQEGTVAVIGPPGDSYRAALLAFQEQYPGIQVELLSGPNPDVNRRALNERQAEQYLWDVIVHAPSSLYGELKPAGALDPLRPVLVLPEVLDDSKWIKGFADGFTDLEKTYAYAFVSVFNWTAYVNRSAVPESELNRLDQLWDPKWVGKMAWQDPRMPSSGARVAGTLLLGKGEAKLRAFMRDQQPVLTRDGRQLTEWAIRARYPIAIAITPDTIETLSSQGIDMSSLQPLRDDDAAAKGLNHGYGAVGLFNRPPHPNAAKVFINWLLSKDGQTIFAQRSLYNSRRTDVAVVAEDRVVDPKTDYLDLNIEETWPVYLDGVKIANEMLK